ncbi:MAG: hypothetical protein M3Q40_09380 [Pseudomonadota bacterium]|nr:hypothetical protein [Pseudomonadota bacterium]
MKTSVIEVRAMLSVLRVEGVERRIGDVPGVESVLVVFAAGNAIVLYQETRRGIADIQSDVRQRGCESVVPAAPSFASKGEGHGRDWLTTATRHPPLAKRLRARALANTSSPLAGAAPGVGASGGPCPPHLQLADVRCKRPGGLARGPCNRHRSRSDAGPRAQARALVFAGAPGCDHGRLQGVMPTDRGDALAVLQQVERARVVVRAPAATLQQEVADTFVKSWQQLLQRVAEKSGVLKRSCAAPGAAP